jgi:hypothetical protein
MRDLFEKDPPVRRIQCRTRLDFRKQISLFGLSPEMSLKVFSFSASGLYRLYVWLSVLLAVFTTGHAATIWNGPLITYNQPAPDPTQATNQDRLTPDVWLTRAKSKGLFNAFYETNATALSPTNTEWAYGSLTNCTSLQYTNWLGLLNGQSPVVFVGQPLVVHLISDDIYVALTFTNWVAGGSGGFAYQRSTPSPSTLSGITNGGGQFSFNFDTSAGYRYVVQSSTNLVNWVSVATNTAATNSMSYSNAMVVPGAVFYRVGRVAGP